MSIEILRGESWEAGPQRRTLTRVFWSIAALASAAAACGTAIGGTFATPEMEEISVGWSGPYAVNIIRCLYFPTAVTLPLTVFCLWKAAHRGGMGFWRSTARPALLCTSTAVMFAGLVFERFVAAGPVQLVGLAFTVLAGCAFILFWMLRGPNVALRAGDDYWNKAFALVFAQIGLCSTVGAGGALQHWAKQGWCFDQRGPTFTHAVVREDHWNWREREIVTEEVTYRVPRARYSHAPVAAGLLGLMAVGCFAEMRHRLRVARRARADLL